MTTRFSRLIRPALLALAFGMMPAAADAQTAEARYTAAKSRDEAVRRDLAAFSPTATPGERTKVITEARSVISAYEALVRRFRASGYADNALYNAATLAEALYGRFSLTTDLDAAIRLHKRLSEAYPTAALAKESAAAAARLEPVAEARTSVPTTMEAEPADAAPPAADVPRASSDKAAASTSTAPDAAATTRQAAARSSRAKLTAIERVVMPQLVRVTLALDREVTYHEETLAGPARVFFDFSGAEAAAPLVDAVLRYPTDVVRLIRVGRHPNAIRVVLDLDGVTRHSVYTLYNPYRIVIDAEPTGGVTTVAAGTSPAPAVPVPAVSAPARTPRPAPAVKAVTAATAPPEIPTVTRLEDEKPVVLTVATDDTSSKAELSSTPAVPPSAPVAAPATVTPAAPKAPNVNTAGGFSIARQLGLGVARVVIDPGHGGHDPGAQSKGVNEADLTLDIALRLEKLLQQEAGLEVVLTRRTDIYIPLEERTAIANREGADLFLSIHANTSRATSARGIETYFLSFAGSADAESVAARENSSHAGEMHKLGDIIRAITLNNKLDESRDLAAMVQEALVTRLRRADKTVVNRGVKKAPFVVLIGAEMPSVLAEVSFMTNRQELQMLKTSAYKQRIAEALQAAVMRYRRSLKGVSAVAAQSEKRD